ncbi:2-C-methyl-D-erythritol 4-phosphate cytidylyltransferase [bacterium]|nr:2-C-methyl-D-erythritol 4-phosphate cytidylyltransferase [bacterium]
MVPRTEVIIVAGGQGRRMKISGPKAFLMLASGPLFTHALKTFSKVEKISGIILVVPPGEEEQAAALCRQTQGSGQVRTIVSGGARRQDSVRTGLEQLSPRTEIVLVHDAARPFVDVALVQRVRMAAEKTGAAVPGVRITDTLKRIDSENRVEDNIDRRNLMAIQTPQGFRSDILRQAYSNAWKHNLTATDDAGLVEFLGKPVTVVEGDPCNFKITTSQDKTFAEAWLGWKKKVPARRDRL